jgi:hypothetical protein
MDAEAVLKHRVRNEQTSGEKKSPSKGVIIFKFFPARTQIFRQIGQTFGSRRERKQWTLHLDFTPDEVFRHQVFYSITGIAS